MPSKHTVGYAPPTGLIVRHWLLMGEHAHIDLAETRRETTAWSAGGMHKLSLNPLLSSRAFLEAARAVNGSRLLTS